MDHLLSFATQLKQSILQKDCTICIPFRLFNQNSAIHFSIEEDDDYYLISTQCHDLTDHLAWNMGDIKPYKDTINTICENYHIIWSTDKYDCFSYICDKESLTKGIFHLMHVLSLIGHLGYSLFIIEK